MSTSFNMHNKLFNSYSGSFLRKYLFEDVFAYFKEQNFENERYRYISKKGVLGNSILNLFIRIFLPIFIFFEHLRIKLFLKDGAIYFYADPIVYSDIVGYLSTRTNLIINNPFRYPSKTYNKFSNNLFFIPLLLISQDLIKAYVRNNDKLMKRSYLELQKILLKSKCNFIIINDSILPINRALILVAKTLKIKTVEIQHAIYPSQLKLISGISPDYVFVWGDYFRKMYSNQKINNIENVKILGYPFNVKKEYIEKNKLVVYYLAQGFQYEDINNLDILLNNALEMEKICQDLGMIFKCRLHPNSPKILLDKILPQITCTPKEETIHEALLFGDIFISFNSTALIQASLLGKYCIQLKNIPVLTDDFQELGICTTVLNISDLRHHLTSLSTLSRSDLINRTKPMNSDYVFLNKNGAGERFFNLIFESK